MRKMRRPRRYADGGPATSAPPGGKSNEDKEKLLQSYFSKSPGISKEEQDSFRRALGLPVPTSTTRKPPSRSPNAQAAGERRKRPLTTRPKARTAVPAPRTRTAPPPPPPAPVQAPAPAPSQGGMLGGAMNAIEERNKMLQGLRGGGLVKKKKPVGRMSRPRRTKR